MHLNRFFACFCLLFQAYRFPLAEPEWSRLQLWRVSKICRFFSTDDVTQYCVLLLQAGLKNTVYRKKSFLSTESDTKILQSIYFAYKVGIISYSIQIESGFKKGNQRRCRLCNTVYNLFLLHEAKNWSDTEFVKNIISRVYVQDAIGVSLDYWCIHRNRKSSQCEVKALRKRRLRR